MGKNQIALFVLSSLVLGLFLISVVSAQTLVAGKIYNEDFTSTISGVEVTVQCGSNTPQTTESISKGVYAINFPVDYCDLSDEIKVTLGGDYSGEETGSLKPESDGDITKFAVVNVAGTKVEDPEPTPTNTGGSSSGGSNDGSCTYDENHDWYCSEWGTCVDRTQVRSCDTYNNCGNTFGRPEVLQSCEGGEVTIEGEEGTNPNIFSRITGAVTGTLGVVGSWIVVIFLIGLIASAITVRQIRKRK